MTLWESEEKKDSEPVCLVHSHGPSAWYSRSFIHDLYGVCTMGQAYTG